MGDLPEMKGYRVRLRVAEEYEVALLGALATEAKSQAEADVRGGGQFEAIQDSGPEVAPMLMPEGDRPPRLNAF